MKTKETIYETYTRTLCSNCKNRNIDMCEIRRRIDGTLNCCYYIKDRETEGYKKPLSTTAKQQKPVMKNINK